MKIPVDRTIAFDKIKEGLMVRVTRDGHMLALDFLSTITDGDRKKASQTLARVAIRPETAELLTFRHPATGRKHSRKMLSFSNALQLLLILPKRTVGMPLRRQIVAILVDHFETNNGSTPSDDETQSEKRQHEATPEQRRLAVDRIKRYIELMERCGPLTYTDMTTFRRVVIENTGL